MRTKYRVLIITWCLMESIFSQATENKNDSLKRTYFHYAKIETMTGDRVEAILSRLEKDTVYIIKTEIKFVRLPRTKFRVINNEEETAIAVENINTIKIKSDKNIIYADEFRKRKRKAKKGLAIDAVSTVGAFVLVNATGSDVLNSAYESAHETSVDYNFLDKIIGKKFILKGDKARYNEMLLELTSKKQRNNGFIY